MDINSNKTYFKEVDISKEKEFPIFLKHLEFQPFRHITNLSVEFKKPISVISGTNRSGKSTILMALACSHFDFKKRNPKNGKLERHTWSSLMKFTSHDIQISDWIYYITYKRGTEIKRKKGERKKATKKWSGIGKKESQYKMRDVVFIDLDRIVPARFYGDKIYSLSKRAALANISRSKVADIEAYLSFIFEEKFEIKRLAQHLDKDVYKYSNSNNYSSYNAASGEEVITRIILDIVEAPEKALILIDEVEIGLHPKVQRRLIDVIRDVARKGKKQFILTSHSSTILDSLPSASRIFIEKDSLGTYKAISDISVNAALSKMDAKAFPLIDLYCEDEEGKKIILKGISEVERNYKIMNVYDLINIIISGSADKTHNNFKSHQATYSEKKIKSGYACVLDGDMRNQRSKGKNIYEDEPFLHFLYSNEAPEKFLTRIYLEANSNTTVEYYLENENPHYLFQAIIENSALNTQDEVFEYCWNLFIATDKGQIYFSKLQMFLLETLKHFSKDL